MRWLARCVYFNNSVDGNSAEGYGAVEMLGGMRDTEECTCPRTPAPLWRDVRSLTCKLANGGLLTDSATADGRTCA